MQLRRARVCDAVESTYGGTSPVEPRHRTKSHPRIGYNGFPPGGSGTEEENTQVVNDFRLDRWIVRPSLGTIQLDSTSGEHAASKEHAASQRLSHKVMAVLVCLAERPERLVTKEELFENVWDGAFATDEALSTVVYELRKALGDDARNPCYIETIRKSGYRLIAPVSPLNERTESPTWRNRRSPSRHPMTLTTAAAVAAAILAGVTLLSSGWRPSPGAPVQVRAEPPQIRSLAVRPLATITDECRQDFFAEGLTEMLIADLAYLGPLNVISSLASRSSTEPGVAFAADADAVLEGSVLRTGDRLWISVQLVDNAARNILWGGTFERAIGDALDLQQDLSREIAHQIILNTAPQSNDPLLANLTAPEVTEAFEMGSHFLRQGTPRDNEKARGYFALAIGLDPEFAPAHVGMADTLIASTDTMPAESQAKAYRQAKESVETALTIDQDLPEAHISLASIYFQHEWDWSEAEAHFRRGFGSSRCSVESSRQYAGYLSAMGRHDEAIDALEHGLQCEPTSKTGHLALAWTYYLSRRFEDALSALDKARELDPDYPPIFHLEKDVFLATGREEQALRACQRALELAGDSAENVAALAKIYEQSGIDGVLRCLISRTLEQAPNGDGHLVQLAGLEARLGETEVALARLKLAFEERHDDLVWLRVDPAFDSLRSNDRFAELLATLDLDA